MGLGSLYCYLEVAILLGKGKDGRTRQIAQRILQTLRKVPSIDEIKGGVEVDVIPKPVLRFFINIKLLHESARNVKQRDEIADREEGNNRLHNNDESSRERDET